MPRNRPRTTTKAQWSKEDLENAIQAVRNGESIRKASKKFSIPFSTLQERIKKNLPITGPSLGRHSTFSSEEEKSMAENIKLLAKLFYGLNPLEVRRAAYVYAEKHNIQHRFNKVKQLAGKDWLYGFLKRNPSITIRQPEATSINRVTAFNKAEVTLFFKNLEDIMEKHMFTASKIYNMDETGISTVQDPGTIIAEKGQKRVGSVTSYERGKNITVICAVSAAGSYIPPMFIYPRKRMSPQLCKGGPTEAIYHCSKNGWTNQALFVIWLKHFVKFAKPSSAEPILLIVDNHYSHVSLEAYIFCRENFIVVLSIPPHTSHRMQPLDIAFYGPLKTAFRKECDLFMKSHALQKITPYDVASIFNKAYCDTATIQKGVSGFNASGIMPIDPTIFGEEDFLASDYLLSTSNDTVTVSNDSTANLIHQDEGTPTPEINNNLPGSSAQTQPLPGPSNILTPSKTILSPLPLPTATKTRKRSHMKQHSAILTASPLKADLESKEKKKNDKLSKDNKKTDKKKTHITNKKIKQPKNIKTSKIASRPSSSSDEEIVASKRKKKMYSKSSTSSSNSTDEQDVDNICDDNSDDDISVSHEQETCFICEEFGKNEVWYRCRCCGQWAHKDCSGADAPDEYICDYCDRKQRVRKRLN
ncbi:uncharacterized protein LOC135128298 [Zophobas morio]|uniref:uncharacterized protein LOC135128298 n=1 Tax=Zophobas morio TaxID=2755281 RepID=UPI0030832251